MSDHLINLEKQAFALKNKGDIAQAVVFFEQLLNEEPGWEHGYGFSLLAECYEELARYDEAKIAYNKALQCGRDDPIILGKLLEALKVAVA